MFLRLGLTSFGGPIAHLGYFRQELVVRRGWVDEPAYADLIALCQFLPGPASSQVGFALGVMRGGGLAGGLAAWAGFTLPSALLMLVFGLAQQALMGPVATGLLHGLKLVAVAVVAQAVYGMSRTLTPDRTRAAIALAALAIVGVTTGPAGQVGAIALGAAAGLAFCRVDIPPPIGQLGHAVTRRSGVVALVVCGALLLLTPVIHAAGPPVLQLFEAFYRSGALVFGGGHVVLPLLRAELVPAWLDDPAFLAGYGAAQAMPGPLFSFAAYLGAVTNGGRGAVVALVGIFLPGLLLVYGTLPFWDALRAGRTAQAALRGANAAVVGLLAAALYDPVWTAAIHTPQDFAFAATGFVGLTVWRAPPWLVVGALAAAGALG